MSEKQSQKKLNDACGVKISNAIQAVNEALEAVAEELAKADDDAQFSECCHELDGHLQQALEALEAADSCAVDVKDSDENTG